MKKNLKRFVWVVLDLTLIDVALIIALVLKYGKDCSPYFYLYRELFVYLPLFFHLSTAIFRLYIEFSLFKFDLIISYFG
jgi:hypothetical protein